MMVFNALPFSFNIVLLSLVMMLCSCKQKVLNQPKIAPEVTSPVQLKSPPPPPTKNQNQIALEQEVDSLKKNRQSKIGAFTVNLENLCLEESSEAIFFQLRVNPDGKVGSYKFINESSLASERPDAYKCLEAALSDSTIHLGAMKIIPSARAGTGAQDVFYTLSIR